ncbi:MAG: hypothetical protein A3I26_01350 [Candidatus Yanofskybacteria bacterium RIFCSPLOWO2_02_FULL_43_10]|uniref:Glycosyltransferase 2-like domain-containing protein n=1 Tax=Candidatus Yanofskybacteria bacterium RIFCSPLOWO2_12_FULL_43_11b TaxID=1802710 RepID=A0A1F8H971_9BACT|nr:MAG: hypothetical protein A2742_03970 [Candidatus Yanofskybacteria bacterium RIFCSPHIGHO2_01_FULL_43_32]OGN10566.1 MAG: hypothetical protein A3C69_02350 [Candidatus Yanofskybacteria bacterium RIFCSPHIGHO2_02_FULL_43_12]OGN17767.1 MAG: hypothetical protein A3E34_01310 [Candidatus Yanofskybacteria bacterium RIFCSPHIGHO2_12_FULL_43_11]OGN24511.1 MAG: hypothetical protein A2923_00950 [Candidatus Yanofskybacteria bacterium RIFCSPLOWO2_01_FULL_43_46]OGN28415.1 MAG: hypothetical protein A3I26_01350
MRIHSNNYLGAEQYFFKKTGLKIIKGHLSVQKINKKVSIIIPVYNNPDSLRKVLVALQEQKIPDGLHKNIEIVIVDDGSRDYNQLFDIIRKGSKLFKTTIARFAINQGRSAARNLGLLLSKGKIIIFLDADIIPNKFWLISHVLRQGLCNKIATIGFNQTILSTDPLISIENLSKNFKKINPDYRKDFRYSKYVPISWHKTRPEIRVENFNKTYRLIEDTNFFKNFNFPETIGVWDLPSMFLTGNVALRRSAITEVGGFDMDFRGWGMEDTHLGYKLIKSGVFLIPLLSSSAFHVKKRETDTSKRRWEFKRNLSLYKRKLQEPLKKLTESDFYREVGRKFKNKYKTTLIRDD